MRKDFFIRFQKVSIYLLHFTRIDQNMKKRHQQKLIVLTLVLLIAFNLPILLLFDGTTVILGLPILYIYIFSVWLFSVLVSLLVLNRYYE